MIEFFFVKFVIVFVSIFIGLFGNVNLILIYLWSKQLRSKSGSLIFLGAIIHTACLLSSPLNAIIILNLDNVNPTVCAIMSSVYITGLSMGGTVTIMMAFDLLLNMLVPFKYRLMTAKTFCWIIFPNLCLPILFCVMAFIKGDDFAMWYEDRNVSHIERATIQNCDEQYGISICRPTRKGDSELKEDLRLWLMGKNMLLTATTIVYIICMIALKVGIGLNEQTRKQILKCTMVIVCCFVIACMFHVTCTILLLNVEMHAHTRETILNFSRLHMYLCFSYNFYICIWRSSKIRKAFWDNMRFCLLCKEEPPPSQTHSTNQPSKISSSPCPPRKITVTKISF